VPALAYPSTSASTSVDAIVMGGRQPLFRQVKSSQVNDVDRRRLHLSLYVRSVLKTLVLIFNNLSIKLRSIPGTGNVGSVIKFHILELPKVIKSIGVVNQFRRNFEIIYIYRVAQKK